MGRAVRRILAGHEIPCGTGQAGRTTQNPRFVRNAERLAHQLFRAARAAKPQGKYRYFHFCFVYDGNRLISIGQNSAEPCAKGRKFQDRFGVYYYDSLHAEISAISKLWGKTYIDGRLRFVVIRLSTRGLCNSKPCGQCQTVLDALGVSRVWYSTPSGIVRYFASNESGEQP